MLQHLRGACFTHCKASAPDTGGGRFSLLGPMHSKTKQGPGGMRSGSAVTVPRPGPLEALCTSFRFGPESALRGG